MEARWGELRLPKESRMHGCRPRRALQKKEALAKLGVSMMERRVEPDLREGVAKRDNLPYLLFVPADLIPLHDTVLLIFPL